MDCVKIDETFINCNGGKYCMADIFISYSRRDQEFVRRLHDHLLSDGRDVWVDWESIPLTADWFEEIKAGIEGADSFLFVISPDSVRSEVVAAELEYALSMNKRFVPLLYRELIESHDKAALHPKISSHNWTFMRTDEEFQENLVLLTTALDTDLEHARVHTRILTRALEWDHRGRDTSFVLRGNDLKEAEDWLGDVEGKEPEVNEIQIEYIQASQVAEKWRKRERALTIGITIGIIVAILSAVIAVFQAVDAKQQRDIAEVQRAEAIRQSERAQLLSLAANAQVALTNNNTDLSIALAIASNGGDSGQRSRETERALADAAYSGGTVKRFVAHENDVHAVAFNQDGTLGASGDGNGVVLVWDIDTGEPIHRFTGHSYQVNTVDIDSNNRYVVSAACGEKGDEEDADCTRGDIILWDINSGALIRQFVGHESDVTSVEFDLQGDRLLSGSMDSTMRLWDVETGEQLGVYDSHFDNVVDVAFHPLDSNIAVSMAIDTPPTLWDLETGEFTRYAAHDVTDEPNLEVGSVAFSPDGSHVLGSYGIPIRLWDTQTGELIREFLGHGSYVNSVAFSSDGTLALSSAWRENSFRVWDISNGVQIRRFEGHGGVVRAVTISSDNRFALSASDDDTVRVWDLNNGAEVKTLAGHTDNIFASIYSPNIDDGYIVASAGLDNFIRIWNVETQQQIAKLDKHNEDVWTIAFTPDGSKLVSGGEDNKARIWDMETFEQLLVLEPHDNWVTTVAVSPDGKTVLTGSNDKKVRLWDIKTGQLLKEYTNDGGQLRSVAFTPDGTRFLWGADTARLFDLETGDVIREYSGHSSRINSATFNSDGSLLATGSADATIRLWETEIGDLLTVFEGHSGQVRTVMFNHDDTTILSSSADATIRLWSVNGLELRIFDGHDAWVNQAAFSPDGKFAVSGSWDDSIKIWHIHSVEELIAWTNDNRYVRKLTCNEERIYGLAAENC